MTNTTQNPVIRGRHASAATRSLPSGWGKLWASLGCGALAFFVLIAAEVAGSIWIMAFDGDENTVLALSELLAGAMALAFVVLLGGKQIARPRVQGMGEAWKAAAWLFVADGIFVVIEIAQVLTGVEEFSLSEAWPVRVALLALLCFGIGLIEESGLRGLCLNGLLARMGRSQGGVFGAVLLSSLVFGFLHFDPFIDFGDPLQVAQDFMKVLQTGMVGYLLAGILVKTRNLWAVISIHAANDFMLLFITNGLADAPVTTDYVSTGEEGLAALGVYLVLCALYLPLVVTSTRMIRQAGPWRGDFYHYGEDSPLSRKDSENMKRFSLENVSGLVFDCDGTLLDTMPAWNELEAHMTELTGVPWTQEQYEEIRAVPMNEGARIYHERYGLGNGVDDVLQMIDRTLLGYYRDKSVALPGARELLERARQAGIPCVVVTSSPLRYVLPGFERAGLSGYFKRVITTDDVGLSKQDPRIWHLALAEMGAQPETSWGFDDSLYAVKVMNQVGMNTVGAYDCDETGTFEQLQAEADIAVRSLEELL